MENEKPEELKVYDALTLCGLILLIIGILVGGFLCFVSLMGVSRAGFGLAYLGIGAAIIMITVVNYFVLKALAILVKNSAK